MAVTEAPAIKVRDRSIEADWKLGERTVDEETKTIFATLTVGHSRERKQFYAVLRNETETYRGNGFTARSYPLFGGVSLPSQPVARFSAKKLRDFFDATLADVEARRHELSAIFALEPKDA